MVAFFRGKFVSAEYTYIPFNIQLQLNFDILTFFSAVMYLQYLTS